MKNTRIPACHLKVKPLTQLSSNPIILISFISFMNHCSQVKRQTLEIRIIAQAFRRYFEVIFDTSLETIENPLLLLICRSGAYKPSPQPFSAELKNIKRTAIRKEKLKRKLK
ncbi:hypothetical protein LPB260_14785 [Pseudomonas sp. LPB0260]|uniref:hypothetical protein n=1 Tax=Pseudomonas sp. LPB0260 TaxID=2614442 RepID=UPI0015C29486|nr:hypothetical protein [Pseudomonas sp. LPB0260]QLC74834.1 hypothetical protein LPB260_14785 [Pseudomonas sp. LPB0260]